MGLLSQLKGLWLIHWRRWLVFISVWLHIQTKSCVSVLRLSNHCPRPVSQLPVSMEEVVDLLNDVNQQLGDSGETLDDDEKYNEGHRGTAHSSPARRTEASATISHIKFSTPSPNKSIVSPSKRHLVCPAHCWPLKIYRIDVNSVYLYCNCTLFTDFSKNTTSLGWGPEKPPSNAVPASWSSQGQNFKLENRWAIFEGGSASGPSAVQRPQVDKPTTGGTAGVCSCVVYGGVAPASSWQVLRSLLILDFGGASRSRRIL